MLLSQSEKDAIKATWAKREKEFAANKQRYRNEALYNAMKVCKFLKTKYGVKDVFLYGSLAKDDCFDTHSDIDIYITGWNQEDQFWIMFSQVEAIAAPYPLSIVTEREASPSLKEIVYKEGRLLS